MVSWEAVPDQQDGLADLFVEMANEIEHLLLARGSVVNMEVDCQSVSPAAIERWSQLNWCCRMGVTHVWTTYDREAGTG